MSQRASHSAAQKGDEDTATFLAWVVWVIGTVLLYQCFKIWMAMTMFLPATLWVFPNLTYSQCLNASLWTLIVPLGVLHAAMWMYRRYAVDGERFPGQVGKESKIPDKLRWVRALLFIALLVGPSLTYCFVVGRMFDHLTIIWSEDEHREDPRTSSNAKAGLRLLTDWGYHSDGHFGGPLEGGWHWYAWQDCRVAYDTCDGKGKPTPDKRPMPHDSVAPGLGPTVYSVYAMGIAVSLCLLAFKPLPRKRQAI